MKIVFEIPGEPVAKGRPRVTKIGFTYTPEKTKNYENWVKMCFIQKQKEIGWRKTLRRLKVNIEAYFSIPKSTSKKLTQSMLSNGTSPCKKPDIDNIVKSILDALNMLAYDDDKQVVDLSIQKYYSDRPRVEVEIEEF